MRKSVQSDEQKIKSPESPKPEIDDWYDDWKFVARGTQFSINQNTFRCAYCRRDTVMAPMHGVFDDKVMTGWGTSEVKRIPEYRWNWMELQIIREADERGLCKKEECQTLWAMSVDL